MSTKIVSILPIPFTLVATAVTMSVACSEDFRPCGESRTCPEDARGGEAGDGSGGSAGSGAGRSGSGGKGSGGAAGRGGASGDSGAGGDTGDAGEPGSGGDAGDTSTGGDGGAAGDPGTSGGTGGGTSGGTGGTGPEPDTTPPVILAVSPGDGETGVEGDAVFRVTFSEPMDRVAAQAAYQSSDVPAAGVTFDWNGAGTVLTVNPTSDLPYAEGTSPSLAAREFSVTISTAARDLAGNYLVASFEWSFTTLRRITQTFSVPTTSSWNSYSSAPLTVLCSDTLFVGDSSLNDGLSGTIAVPTAGLPNGIESFEAATFSANLSSSCGSPFTGLGVMRLQHLGVYPPSSVTWSTPALGDLGTFPSSLTPGVKTADVLAAVADDYANRGARQNQSQFRLVFQQATDSDNLCDGVAYTCDGFRLSARYLIP